jgi:hypothetical protein
MANMLQIQLSSGNLLVIDEAELLHGLRSQVLEQAIISGKNQMMLNQVAAKQQATAQQAGNQQPTNDQLDLGTTAGVNKALGMIAANSQAQRQIYRAR